MATLDAPELGAIRALITGLDEYIRARYPLIAIQTFEEQRFLRLMDGLVRDLARWFSAMNWQDDRQLETLIGELEALASRPASKKRKRDPGPIKDVLQDIIALTYDDARAVLEPSRFDALEL